MAMTVKVEILKGQVAPRYEKEISELDLNKVDITEHGMRGGAPLLDFQFTDKDGRHYFAAVTGKLVQGFAAAVDGVIARNAGSSPTGPEFHS